MSDALHVLFATARCRVEADRAARPPRELRALAADAPPVRPLPAGDGFDLIAELKRRSPARGALPGRALGAVERARRYAAGGAGILSVLTEPTEFDGSLDDLRAVAAATPLPALRKDFLVDPYQVDEARAAGASLVLLIVHEALSDETLRALADRAGELGMAILLEGHEPRDLDRATRLAEGRADGGVLLGLNARDLRTLDVETSRFDAVDPKEYPRPLVAESGIGGAADLERVARAGYRMALVGTLLMADDEPEPRVRRLLAAARRARGVPA